VWRWRLIALVLLAAGFAWPLVRPFLALPQARPPEEFLEDGERLLLLAGNTALLVFGTLLLALPIGIAAAVLLYRTDLPLRGFFRRLTLLALFVPLAVLTTAWQTALGGGPGSLVSWWHPTGRPWVEGIEPAIWIHAQAALPWVILIVGHGLSWAEPELEEDALLAAGTWTVLWRVTLPRCRGSILAAAAWVALQVSTELTVAGLMLVPTAAELVYSQLWRGGASGLATAVAVSLPLIIGGGAAVAWGLLRLERVVPPLQSLHAPARLFALCRARWPAFLLMLLLVGLVVGVPLSSLVRKTGMAGPDQDWSAALLLSRMAGELRNETNDLLVAKSLLAAGLTGALVAGLALVLCWLAVDAPRFRLCLFVTLAVAWAVPGPIAAIGLKEHIMVVITDWPWQPLLDVLHNGFGRWGSPAPVLWAHTLRFLPCAVAILWPVVRALPGELRDQLHLDGATPRQELGRFVVPLAWRAWWAAGILIAALSVCEVGAVVRGVETPGWQMLAHILFDRMHYGQVADVSALCLRLLAGLVLVAAASMFVTRGWARLTANRRSRPAGR
jgi:iron(III) transport system permease protein